MTHRIPSGRGRLRAVAPALALIWALSMLAPTAAAAQFPPESFTNLEVLPEDIAFRDLMDVMRGFTRALDARCSSCHVGAEDQPLATYDFASDSKAMKRKARAMLRMVRAINGEHLADLEDRDARPITVQCFTCHRGVREPRMLQDELRITYDRRGAEAMLDQYHRLRERYYGRAAYDFETPGTLVDVGTSILPDDPEAAVAVFRLNVELFPDAWQARFNLGVGLEAVGDTEGAIAAYRRTLDLQPGYPAAARRLEALGG